MLEKLNNLTAEQAVLGAILFDAQCAELATLVCEDDFSVPEHHKIFRCIQREIDHGRKPTALSIAPAITNMQCGPLMGPEYIAKLASVADRTTAKQSVDIIREFTARRSLMGIGGELKRLALEIDIGPSASALQIVEHLNDIIDANRRAPSKAQSIFETVADVVSRLDDPDDGRIISTGVDSLDAFMGGWPRGELSIVGARPSMGKSALLSAVARRGAANGVSFLIFSKEMRKSDLAARMLSDFCYSDTEWKKRVPYKDIINKKWLNKEQKDRLALVAEEFRKYDITIDDQRGLSMAEIKLRCLRHADYLDRQGRRLDVVMVDHIGKIRPSDRYRGQLTNETGEKSDALMNMAYDQDVAVIAAHQLNRNTEGREDKHPTQSDLRDSGNLEADTHTLIFPYRQSYYLERQKLDKPELEKIRIKTLEKKKNVMEILVAKCRNGACGTVEVFADMPHNYVRDLTFHEKEELNSPIQESSMDGGARPQRRGLPC